MCEYCGCQSLAAIAELTAEHDRLRDLGRDLARAADAGDLPGAQRISQTMRRVLAPHTAVEEDGLFPAMAGDFPDQIDALTGDHRDIDSALAELDADDVGADWPRRIHTALARLFEHILKEQDGVFPAALAALTARDWERVARSREAFIGMA